MDNAAQVITAVGTAFHGHVELEALVISLALVLAFVIAALKIMPQLGNAIADRIKDGHAEGLASITTAITEMRGSQLEIKATVDDLKQEVQDLRQDVDGLQKISCDVTSCPNRLRRSTDVPPTANPNTTAPSAKV